MAPGISKKWRTAIFYILNHVLGSPLEECWDDLGTISDIMHRLNIPHGSREAVRSTMRNAISSTDLDSDSNVNVGSSIRGRRPLVADASEEAMIVFRGPEAGISVCAVAILVNEYRMMDYPNGGSVTRSNSS